MRRTGDWVDDDDIPVLISAEIAEAIELFRRLHHCGAITITATGFDPSLRDAGHLGLTMAERAVVIGAGLDITSAPGSGTVVTVMLPTWPPLRGAGSTRAPRLEPPSDPGFAHEVDEGAGGGGQAAVD